MAYNANKMLQKFGSVNKERLKMKARNKRTRTGQFKTGRIAAHGRHHKHR